MKARRRHELRQNVLDAELARGLGFFKRYGTRISWLVLIAALAVLSVVYVRAKMRRKHLELRQEYDVLVLGWDVSDVEIDPQERLGRLGELAGQDSDEHIAAMAQVALGDTYARRALFGQGGLDRESLSDKAADCYRRTLTRFPGELVAAAKARIGLARLAENRRDFEAAKAEYEAVRQMVELRGHPVQLAAASGLGELKALTQPVRMVATLPAEPLAETAPAEAPTRPAATKPDQPASGPDR